jgi:hypothetical protein
MTSGAARSGVRAAVRGRAPPWPGAELGGGSQVVAPAASPRRPVEELRRSWRAVGKFDACCNHTFYVFLMFQKNVANVAGVCCKNRFRCSSVAYVSYGCCIFNEMFHVDFECPMQHETNVAVGSFSSSMDG